LLKMAGQLIVGFIFGLLLIKLVPFPFSFPLSEIFVAFIFHPLKFFAVSIVFTIGIMMYGNLFGSLIAFIVSRKKRKSIPFLQFCIFLCIMVEFFVLFRFGPWQAIVLLCFSIIYGMMTLDFRKEKAI
jgi:hypothetical protein